MVRDWVSRWEFSVGDNEKFIWTRPFDTLLDRLGLRSAFTFYLEPLQLNPQLFRENFAQDVSPAEAEIMAIAQKPFNQSEIFEKSGPPAWTQLPTWYQVSSNDRMLSPDTERIFAKRMNATTISLPASHASYVSHPNEIAQLILNATKGIRK